MDGAPVRRRPRDWLVDALLFLLAIGFTAATFFDSAPQHPAVSNVDAAFGIAASLGLWTRRRRPVGFAVLAGVLSIYSVSASAVAILAMFTVAVHRRASIAVLVAVGYSLASLATPPVRPDLAFPGWPTAALGTVGAAAILAWGMFIRSRRQLADARRDQTAAEAQQRIVEVRLQERQRIAREMHDVLGHRLSLLCLHAEALQVSAPPDIADAASLISHAARRAIQDLRDVIGVLRTDGLPQHDIPEPPQPALTDLLSLVVESEQAGMQIALYCDVPELEPVPDALGRTVFRTVQEGLTNARKHAPAAQVAVSVTGAQADGITVEVRNPLPEKWVESSGSGLIGLAERTSLAGGHLQHGPTPTGDFQLRAWLPWPA